MGSEPAVPDNVVDAIEEHRWQELWELSGATRLLNHGSFGRPFQAVRDWQQDLTSRIDADPGEFFRESHDDRIRSAADEVGRSLGVDNGRSVAFRHNASTAIIDAVGSLARRDDVVLMTNLGYGGVGIGVRSLGEVVGFRVVTIEFGRLEHVVDVSDRVLDAVRTHHPAVVVIDEITSDTALLLPVAELAVAIQEVSPQTRVVVDGAHSAGMLSSPALEVADVWVSNLHKWPCAATGSGVIVARDGTEVGPLQRSWSGEQAYPDSFTWTGTDDSTAYLTAPLALEILDQMKSSGLEGHIDEVLDKACSALAAEWDVPIDARPEGMRAPWMRLVELPVPGPRTQDWAAWTMATARRSLDLDVAVTFFGENAYVRLSAHGYNTVADYERLVELPSLLARFDEDAPLAGSAGTPPNVTR